MTWQQTTFIEPLVKAVTERVTDTDFPPDRYFAACRRRIPAFVESNYGWPGALALNRRAWGIDVLVAPINFLMGFPNFLLRVLALLLELMRARRAARWLLRCHLGFPTKVQEALTIRIMEDLLALPMSAGEVSDPFLRRVAAAAQEPITIYVQTRNVAADITAGTLAAIVGVVAFSQFTPGSISAGAAIARAVAREQAISEFALGEVAGRLFYAMFPVHPSPTLVVVTLLVVTVAIAVVAAFSGFLHDPLQARSGIHARRLTQLTAAIEAATSPAAAKAYRPKDVFVGRVYDVVDWLKGWLSFW
jgi:hypothetical protein